MFPRLQVEETGRRSLTEIENFASVATGWKI